MRKIRRNCFETNSSSTHAICIPNEASEKPNSVHFGFGDFGWNEEYADPEDYLYTAICNVYGDDIEKFDSIISWMKEVMDKNNIRYNFAEPKWDYSEITKTRYLSCGEGYVDHSYELREFIEEVTSDEDLFLRYLSSGEILTGNDNDESSEDVDKFYDSAIAKGWKAYYKGN